MKIDAADKDIGDILNLGYFKIPRFQRPYSWELDEVQTFWDDVVNGSTDDYFIGSMVAYQINKPYYGIVDGQQRLTTITLMLAALRNAFFRLGNDNLAKGIHQFIERENVDYENEYILNAETSFPYFHSQIQAYPDEIIVSDNDIGVEEQNLKNAFDRIESNLIKELTNLPLKRKYEFDKLKDKKYTFSLEEDDQKKVTEYLRNIRDKIRSLKLVFINLDNEEDAYLIFETLNARGKDLRVSDLIKNLLLQKIKSSSKSVDKPKEAWNSIVNKLSKSGTDVVDNYVVHYWLANREYTTEKELFAKVKKYINTDQNNAQKILNELGQYSEYYLQMLMPNSTITTKEMSGVRNSLNGLRIFNVRQQSSLVLALLAAYKSENITLKNLKKSLKLIEYFHFQYNAIASKRSSGSIATGYSKLALELKSVVDNDSFQKFYNNLHKHVSEKMPKFDEFDVKFKQLIYLSDQTRNRNIIKYVFTLLMEENNPALNLDYESLTIEHLVSQSTLKDINLGKEQIVGGFGNLILVSTTINSNELANKSIKDKMVILRDKQYPFLQNLLEYNFKGTDQEIEARLDRLSKKVYEITKI
ncbi:DUF262 domain-containing protein [Acinetobacter variabilis]|uniref:DUF262 domain-containing protein n=1 Tax=Acinetobacter variabilis TaxID=70346 RepID=A0A7T7WJ36_9GAMM|nr:DUF262 domain-containing protein [Acinetobacter variabilis]QQN88395.1 DUF262 domain-containing protein [Acinetobacter variabilis]